MSRKVEMLLDPGKYLVTRIRDGTGRNHAKGVYLFIGHLVADFNYVRGDTVFKNFDSLRCLHSDCQFQFGATSGLEDFSQGHCERAV